MFVDDAVPGKFADAVFCIFDGHAGKLSATKCAEEFLQRICDALPEDEKPSTSSGKRKESNNNNNNNNKTSLDDDNVANSAVLAQEQLGQYLDLVESVIMKRVGDRAEAFLEAMAKTKKLQETIEETKKAVVDLRTNNRRSFRRAAHATAKVKETWRRRDNILRMAETLKDIENIRQTKLDVDVLLESGEYSECLEAIDECERSLRAAIERATKNNSEEGEVEEEKGSSSMSSASNKHMNISNSSGGKSNAATTTTKNVFSCFSHLPKDLEIAKRKCTGAITAELCSEENMEKLEGRVILIPNADPGEKWLLMKKVFDLKIQ